MRTARLKPPNVARYLKDNRNKLAILDPFRYYPVRIVEADAEMVLGEGIFVRMKLSELIISSHSAN